MDFVSPPAPTESTLTNIITRDVEFPNGRIVRLSLSEWHWAIIAFYDLWSADYGREQGILYEWYKALPNRTDRMFGDSIMLLMRDDYSGWLETLGPGEELRFPPPKKSK